MDQNQLQKLWAFHEQLLALAAANVPLDVGFSGSASELARQVERAQAVVARRAAAGETWEAICNSPDPALPEIYRAIVRIGLASGDWARALDGVERLAQTRFANRHWVRQSLLYPLIIGALAYVGLIGATLFVTPVVSNLYDSLGIAPRWGLASARWLRQEWPVWVAGCPAVALLLALILRGIERAAGRASLGGRVLAPSKSLCDERAAAVADSFAFQLDQGIERDVALEDACRLSGDTVWQAAGAQVAQAWRHGDVVCQGDSVGATFPPFFRWAVLTPAPRATQVESLHAVASFYRAESDRLRSRFHQGVQWSAMAVLGGGATLIYALTLLAPVLQLLVQLA